MNIDDSVFWCVDTSVGNEVGKCGNGGLDSDVYDEVRSSDNKVFEL